MLFKTVSVCHPFSQNEYTVIKVVRPYKTYKKGDKLWLLLQIRQA